MQCKCGMQIAQGRLDLGLRSCLECGEAQATEEKLEKSNRVAIAYSKGPFMYMGSEEVAKANLRGTMNAQGRSIATLFDGSLLDSRTTGAFKAIETITGRFPARDPKISNRPSSLTGRLNNLGPEMQELKPRRKVIGVAYLLNGDSFAVYSRADPILQKAVRKVFF